MPNVPVILILILTISLSLTLFFSLNSAETIISKGENKIEDGNGLKRMKMVLGSKPPRCVNKCMNCRPCMAVLVIYQNRNNNNNNNNNNNHNESPREHESSYYHLAWKCKCRNKIFQP